MRILIALTRAELRLFRREPFALVFTFAFPLVVLLAMFGSFSPGDPQFGGASPNDYYLAGYVVIVIAAIGLISLPLHLATYAERGVLRRFDASGVPRTAVLGAQLIVGAVMAAAGSAVLVAVGAVAFGAALPHSPVLVLLAFGLSALAFLSAGMLIARVTRTARAAQAAGMILFFPMWLLSGAGPPPDVMSASMRAVSELLPLTYAVRAVQSPWLGSGADGLALLVLAALLVASGVLAIRRPGAARSRLSRRPAAAPR